MFHVKHVRSGESFGSGELVAAESSSDLCTSLRLMFHVKRLVADAITQ